MSYTFIDKDEIRIAGIEVRTSNQAEANAATARIPGLWQRFYKESTLDKIPDRVDCGTIIEAYTDYESDHEGEYTVVLGAEVSSFENLPSGITTVTAPRSRYLVTPVEGEMPQAVKEAWQRVWDHFDSPQPHRRTYQVDFEQFKSNDKGSFGECQVMIAVA